jgi:protocatechuate 3,4-dioxygenase beta subunit
MMMLPSHSTEGLFINPDKTLSADISDLSMGNTKQVFGQVYDDACDDGLILVSHKTGQEVRMVVTRTVHDKEGDVTHWCLRSVRADERRLELPYTLELTIYND